MIKYIINKPIYKLLSIIVLVGIIIYSYQFFDIDGINNLIIDSQDKFNNKGIYIIALIFLLRSISIVFPVIPGTYCVVIAGYIYGIKNGMLIMFAADLLSCYSSFLISRNLGRSFVRNILGVNQMKKVESIGNKYLEKNFFLMTGFLMTSWFDFVCYAVGLTKLSWKKFMPALIISIIISDLPFIAGGYALSEMRDVSIRQVINGEVDLIKGPYLIVLIISVIIIFGIGLFNLFLNKKTKVLDQYD